MLVNGQTGCVAGKAPISWVKVFCTSVATQLLVMFEGSHGGEFTAVKRNAGPDWLVPAFSSMSESTITPVDTDRKSVV